EETARREAGGVAWLTPPNLLAGWEKESYPNRLYNLGLAHGVPGVVALLGGTCAAGVAHERARPLLDASVRWLLGRKLSGEKLSCFPSHFVEGSEPDDCRLAWCYGDAGVAPALLLAARAVGETEWECEASAVARRAAEREPGRTGVTDAGLCHGAAGLAHVFNRLHHATGEACFAEASRLWFERTLGMRRPGRGFGGFQAFRGEDAGREFWEDAPGLLEGSAGVALALLSAATDVEPEWDSVMLLSLPARGAR
ncbi:MAG TPA: lanthionine synthetase LanC family protein, partial [Pyrinomonadaceae bacterium]|nr:lanthionine synthetase LanC family protein [Pyrinomonadaceae bacterium]